MSANWHKGPLSSFSWDIAIYLNLIFWKKKKKCALLHWTKYKKKTRRLSSWSLTAGPAVTGQALPVVEIIHVIFLFCFIPSSVQSSHEAECRSWVQKLSLVLQFNWNLYLLDDDTPPNGGQHTHCYISDNEHHSSDLHDPLLSLHLSLNMAVCEV